MFVRPKMLRVGHVLPKIPRQIPIICRHKLKTRGHAREMGEKGAKEKKGNPENKSPAENIFFIISILLVFYYRFFILFYYILLLYLFFYYRFIIELLLYFLLYRFY